MNSSICSNRIVSGLSSQAKNIVIEVVNETESTNTDLLKRASKLAHPTVLIALKQTAGRGRHGKAWYSEQNGSLTFSLAWHFSSPVQQLSGLSLAVGASLAQTLHHIGMKITLKWPNDILREGKKLAGILIELPAEANRQVSGGIWVIIGIGINLVVSDEMEAQIDQPAAEALWLSKMDRNKLMAKLLNGLTKTLTEFDQNGLAPFINTWNEFHSFSGEKVTIFENGQAQHTGKVIGIDEYGRLILENNGNRVLISAGDVSLRPFEG